MTSSTSLSTTSVVILTGSELRHTFLRKAVALSPGVRVLATYCEGLERTLPQMVRQQKGPVEQRLAHLTARDASEDDFFGAFVLLAPDLSAPIRIPRGDRPEHVEAITAVGPDLLLAFGCSLIREPLLSRFAGRFVNIHLGLSPYYRGSGTNFWALADGRPECVGATFMHIDAGIDTGEVIHQLRARVLPGDTPHQIGNRLIRDVAIVAAEIVRCFRALERLPQLPRRDDDRVCRSADFTEEAVLKLRARFADGLVERYLAEIEDRQARVPILENPAVRPLSELIREAV